MVYPLFELAAADPDRLLVADDTRVLSRQAFNDRVNRAIHMLWDRAISPGKAVAIMALNSSDFAVLACATSFGGVSLVPINWHLKPDEVSYILAKSGAAAVIAGPEHIVSAKQAASAKSLEVIEIGAQLDDLLAQSSSAEIPDTSPYATQVYFTSGTTGRPKATKMSQMPEGVTLREAIDRLRAVNALVYGEQAQERSHLVTGPLYHAGPLHNCLQSIISGGRTRIMARFDAEKALKLIEEYAVTHLMLAPIMFSRFLSLPSEVRASSSLASLQQVVHLGAPTAVSIKRQMIDWWGPVFSDAYGGSEIGTISRITCEEWMRKPGSVGRPISTFSVQIIGDDDKELPPGEIGLIYVTSHTDVDLAYVDDAIKTKAAHRNDKQFTLGDMGWVDEDGYLYLADRRVDMINSGGVNIYPAEVEAAIAEHPAVADAAVFGVPNVEWGQEVKAAIQLRPEFTPSDHLKTEIIDFAKARIASFKVPRSIDFHEALPRYPNGKLHRRELRDPYWSNLEASSRPLSVAVS